MGDRSLSLAPMGLVKESSKSGVCGMNLRLQTAMSVCEGSVTDRSARLSELIEEMSDYADQGGWGGEDSLQELIELGHVARWDCARDYWPDCRRDGRSDDSASAFP